MSSDIDSRLDPTLRHLASFRTDLALEVLPAVRDSLNARRRESAEALDTSGVDIVDGVTAAGGGHSVPLRIYRGGSARAPAVIFCHSGAFVLGNLDTDHRQCVELARRAACTVVSVDYRLAPEHPHPAGLDDVRAALEWLVAEADRLDVDVARLAVAGSSAGGALAALLAQSATAGTAPPVMFQLLHQPVLDDGPTPSKREFSTTPGFDGPAAKQMWRHVLGSGSGAVDAVPARSAELAGLPNAFITCSELDPLRDEAIEYALRLMRSGVATELHVVPGTCHGFDSLMPDGALAGQLFALQGEALRRALHA